MKFSHKIVLSAAALLVAAGLTAHQVLAANDSNNNHDLMLDKIASTFNIDRTKLQETADQFRSEKRAEMQAERQAEIEKKLSEAVTAGKITEQQKTLILEKHAQMKTEREQNTENFKNQTREERQAAMEKQHQELVTWLQSNGIAEDVFMMGPQDGMKQGRGGMGAGRPPMDGTEPTQE